MVDVLPTVCDMLGIGLPFGIQGKSILTLLENKNIPEKEFVSAYAESGYGGLYWDENDGLTLEAEGALHSGVTYDCLNTWTQCGQVRAVWQDGYHLQLDMMGNGHLYEVAKDPYERYDLWDIPEYNSIKTKMLQALAESMMKAADPIPVPHNRYRTKVHPKGYWNQEYHAADPGVRRL